MKRERVLITGAGGFLGRSLARYVSERHPGMRVVGLGRRPAEGVRVCDLLHFASVRRFLLRHRPTLIFHCAGTTRPLPWDPLLAVHATATASLLEAVRRIGPPFPRTVVVGSAAEYGTVPASRQPILESEPPKPATDYGLSKRLETAVALVYAEAGLPIVVARIFNLLDVGLPEQFATTCFHHWIARARRSPGLLVKLGSLGGVRDFISINDACRALVALADRGRVGEIYNVCSGRGVPMRTLWREMVRRAAVELSWRENAGGSARSLARRCVGNAGKIRRHTGWVAVDDPLVLAGRMVAK